jgi:hypothetical protein
MPDVAMLLGGLVIGYWLRRRPASAHLTAWFSRVANRRKAAILLCAAVAMLPRLALLPWLAFPVPAVQDEFSYILGAQTLAAGRLTNPTPALWQHFESFHINLVPSYQSMYQPAPSLFYALGILVAGNPWWGVWLSTGLMCGAICWALQPLLRPRYAMLAGLLCALKFGVYTSYSDSYWGGSVCALGAALTLGACVRLRQDGRLRYVPLLILGVALLANSRIFEGFLFSIPIAIATLAWMVGRRQVRAFALAVALLAVMFAAMGHYNLRGTGHVLQMPYIANFHQYHFVRPFLGAGTVPTPAYRHASMARLYQEWEGQPGELSRSMAGVLTLTGERFRYYYHHQFAPLLFLVVLASIAELRAAPSRIRPLDTARSNRRLLVYTFWLVVLGLFSVVWRPANSYPAPLLVSFFGLSVLGIRHLRVALRRRRTLAWYWSRGLMAGLLLLGLGLMISDTVRGLHQSISYPLPWNLERVRIIHDLERRGGRYLVFVKYAPDHPINQEWVYNGPDIATQQVILARPMGTSEDCQLVQQYAGRQVLVLAPDIKEPVTMLTPWPGFECPSDRIERAGK